MEVCDVEMTEIILRTKNVGNDRNAENPGITVNY